MITDKSIQMILDKLTLFAQSIGMGVKDIFPYFVKQQYIISILGIFQLLCAVIYFRSMFIWLPLLIKFGQGEDWGGLSQVGIGITIIISIGAIVFMIIGISDMVHFLNPKYHAITNIISLFKPEQKD